MRFICPVLIIFSCLVLSACGEDVPDQQASTPTVQPPAESQTATTSQAKAVSQSAGGVTVKILPEAPTSTGCLRAVIQGVPGRSNITWQVNGEVVSTGTDSQLCSDSYKT